MQTQLVMLAILLILMCGVAAVQVWLPNLTIPTTAANLEKQDCIRSLVTRVSTVLTENNIPHFAFYGTLLGLHRGKDIILGDDDGDVCVRAEDAAKVFNAKWHHHGLRFASMNEKCKKRNVLPDHASLLRVYAKAYYVDIYLMDQDKRTGQWSIRTRADYCNKHNNEDLFPINKHIELDGTKIPVPQNTQRVLSRLYGPKFMIPRSKFKGNICRLRKRFSDASNCSLAKTYRATAACELGEFRHKLLHMTWKTDQLTPAEISRVNKWRTVYPKWTFKLWLDDDINDFVATQYAWFMPVWVLLTPFIKKVDCVRYMWMYTYGGMYVDFDTVCKKSVDPLLNFANAAYIPVHKLQLNFKKDADKASPAFLMSAPNNPIWLLMLLYIAANFQLAVKLATGPNALTNVLMGVESQLDLIPVVLVREVDFGIGPNKKRKKGTYSYHENHTTWRDEPVANGERTDAVIGVINYLRVRIAAEIPELDLEPFMVYNVYTNKRLY